MIKINYINKRNSQSQLKQLSTLMVFGLVLWGCPDDAPPTMMNGGEDDRPDMRMVRSVTRLIGVSH